ncbi:MAG: ribonuclease III domain-containing protein, partial [Vampirovibrionia bacterium]
TKKLDKLHTLTTSYVNSLFQVELLEHLRPSLTEKELEIIRRARNQSLTSSKRKEQTAHRTSTSFEALMGYLYLTDQDRLNELFNIIDLYIENKK